MSYKSIKNLGALCNHLITRYGVDGAKSVLSNEYNYNGPVMVTSASVNMRNASASANKQAMLNNLSKLRALWKAGNAKYNTMDKRTTAAKEAKVWLDNIVKLGKGQALKLQVTGA